ncbi:GNAT family N-acetyltransferase [Halorhabdus sp. CBA1104]|uniref:GNAT family N-acetyltransferase n=1 Tax=Halorhabdus sp. CBA1104 TaxID=1380432 RepID=UPI0012B3AA29|nr:GNAT family N-acetyltransferase [Halorhabdus sp. CBA1104]QGN06538.1 GNAT family N-acetyltransferase [Halorhabdus sp. CBA1104]
MVEHRPVAGEDVDAHRRIRRYAFHAADGPDPEDEDGPTIGQPFGLYDDGTLVSIAKHYAFDARLRGEWVDLAGLGAVATPPAYRDQGYARRSLQASVERLADEETPLVALWPFETAFYRQFGWTTANYVHRFDCHADALTEFDVDSGTFHPVGPDDWESLEAVHLAAGDGETLSVRRSEQWWRNRILRQWGQDRRHAYRYDRAGTPAGYLAYEVEDGTLSVAYMGAVDYDALRALLSFVGRHRAQIETVAFERAEGAALLDVLSRPQDVECTLTPGPMVRATDVAMALEAVSYPDTVEADVTLTVTDPLVPDNAGQYRLCVADGRGLVESDPDTDSDARIGVAGLSGLIVGARDATATARAGSVEFVDTGVERTLDELFPTERVFLREFF